MPGTVPHERPHAITFAKPQRRQRIGQPRTGGIDFLVASPMDAFTIVVTHSTATEMTRPEPVQSTHAKGRMHHGAEHGAHQSPAAALCASASSAGTSCSSPRA